MCQYVKISKLYFCVITILSLRSIYSENKNKYVKKQKLKIFAFIEILFLTMNYHANFLFAFPRKQSTKGETVLQA